MPSKKGMKCSQCGSTPHYGSNFTHKVDGVPVSADALLCATCVTEKPSDGELWYYCVGCEGFYLATKQWVIAAGGMGALHYVPCPDHSAAANVPKVECQGCNQITTLMGIHTAKSGDSYCEPCTHDIERCAADYCRIYVHPDQPGVEVTPGGTKMYHPKCALAKTIPNGLDQNNFHPQTWDYREGCPCSACTYLAGRSDKWPNTKVIMSSGSCASCSQEVRGGMDKEIPGVGIICHICSTYSTKKCAQCGKTVPASMFHVIHSDMPIKGPTCDKCIEDQGFWYCDVQCNAWWEESWECSCGGVHGYKYSPEPEFFYLPGETSDPEKTAFLGIEIEVEAQKPGTSKKAGADLVRELVGDFTYCVHDGSLGGTSGSQGPGTGGESGFEIVTHPVSFAWFQENWKRFEGLLNALSDSGYRSWEGGRCGIHVHISRAPMDERHQMNFIRFIYGSTNLALCIGQRDYRDPNLKKYSPFDKETRSDFIQKVRNHTNPGVPGNKHYAAVNANKPETLEARWFRGTLNPRSFLKNVEFIHSVYAFTGEYGLRSANEYNYIDWLHHDPQSQRYATLLDYIERHYIVRR